MLEHTNKTFEDYGSLFVWSTCLYPFLYICTSTSSTSSCSSRTVNWGDLAGPRQTIAAVCCCNKMGMMWRIIAGFPNQRPGKWQPYQIFYAITLAAPPVNYFTPLEMFSAPKIRHRIASEGQKLVARSSAILRKTGKAKAWEIG